VALTLVLIHTLYDKLNYDFLRDWRGRRHTVGGGRRRDPTHICWSLHANSPCVINT
jgi:hypothetical protein